MGAPSWRRKLLSTGWIGRAVGRAAGRAVGRTAVGRAGWFFFGCHETSSECSLAAGSVEYWVLS